MLYEKQFCWNVLQNYKPRFLQTAIIVRCWFRNFASANFSKKCLISPFVVCFSYIFVVPYIFRSFPFVSYICHVRYVARMPVMSVCKRSVVRVSNRMWYNSLYIDILFKTCLEYIVAVTLTCSSPNKISGSTYLWLLIIFIFYFIFKIISFLFNI